LAGRKREGLEPQGAHRLKAVDHAALGHAGHLRIENRSRPLQVAAFADKRLDIREEGDRGRAVLLHAEDRVGHLVRPVASFVERQRRVHRDAMPHRADAVQERGDMAVVAQVVGGPAVDGDRSGGREGEHGAAHVGQGHLHQLDLVRAVRDEVENLRPQPQLPVLARHLVPEQACFEGHRFLAGSGGLR
jgi:hypothetical protein